MLELIAKLLTGLLQFLGSFLPASPFQNLTLGEDVARYLGWLNWLVPIGPMLALVGAVLAALVIVRIVLFFVGKFKTFTTLIGGGA